MAMVVEQKKDRARGSSTVAQLEGHAQRRHSHIPNQGDFVLIISPHDHDHHLLRQTIHSISDDTMPPSEPLWYCHEVLDSLHLSTAVSLTQSDYPVPRRDEATHGMAPYLFTDPRLVFNSPNRRLIQFVPRVMEVSWRRYSLLALSMCSLHRHRSIRWRTQTMIPASLVMETMVVSTEKLLLLDLIRFCVSSLYS